MAYPFPKSYEHRVYPSTFLMGVEWRLHYHIFEFEKARPFFERFVKESFGIELRPADFDALGIMPARFNRGDKAHVKITPHFAEFRLSGDAYDSYEKSMRTLLNNFITMVESANGRIDDVSCNKKNLVVLGREETTSEPELFSLVFSPNLLEMHVSQLRESNLNEPFSASLNFIKFIDGQADLQVLYGAYRIEEQDGAAGRLQYGVQLESQCEVENMDNTNIDIATCDKINTILYDFFQWTFSDAVFEAMEVTEISETHQS